VQDIEKEPNMLIPTLIQSAGRCGFRFVRDGSDLMGQIKLYQFDFFEKTLNLIGSN
jgi:hypothetical protein